MKKQGLSLLFSIARLVLTGCLVREVGLNEADTQATIRGKGYVTSPETMDKKVGLALALILTFDLAILTFDSYIYTNI